MENDFYKNFILKSEFDTSKVLLCTIRASKNSEVHSFTSVAYLHYGYTDLSGNECCLFGKFIGDRKTY